VNCVSDFLKYNEYFTVMAEKALKHIADKSTRKVPHSRIFQPSSMLCMNLLE
jgi:translation elongation factor EF-Ts